MVNKLTIKQLKAMDKDNLIDLVLEWQNAKKGFWERVTDIDKGIVECYKQAGEVPRIEIRTQPKQAVLEERDERGILRKLAKLPAEDAKEIMQMLNQRKTKKEINDGDELTWQSQTNKRK